MKKIIIAGLALLLTIGLNAQKIKVVEGDISVLKGQSKVLIQYTYNDLKVGKLTEAEYIEKKRKEADERESGGGDKWESAWKADRVEHYKPKFEDLFNKYNDKTNIMVGSSFDDANYIMTIQTDFIEPGWNIGISRSPAFINLTIKIAESANPDTPTVIIELLKSPGSDAMGYDFDSGYRIGEAYAKAGKEFAKMLAKKLK